MSDEPEVKPGDAAAEAVPDPRDRRRQARRSGVDRRDGRAAPPGTDRRAGDRREGERRARPNVADQYRGNTRSINEYPLDPDELEFINAVNAYKQTHHRPFPTWSEVLHVLKFLGYRKPHAAGGGTAAEPPAQDAQHPATPR